MKDYREMADNVLRRRDEYKAERRKEMKKMISVLSCFCFAALLGAGVWNSGLLQIGETAREGDVQSGVVVLEDVDGQKDVAGQNGFKEEGIGAGGDVPPGGTDTGNVDYTEKHKSEEAAQGGEVLPGGANIGDGIRDALEGIEDIKRMEQESSQAAVGDFPGDVQNAYNEIEGKTEPGVTVDMPVTANPGDTGELTAYDQVWGGCYMDQSGHWVVWLTEDTPENRETVFRMNPTLSRDTTIFKKADYSKAYLTELMANISKAMGTKELPFVTTAALMEQINRVEVRVTTEDAESIERVLAFDSIGGAIEIRYSGENVKYADALVEELIKAPMP